MSAADVGVGGPSSPGSEVTLVARLQARFHVISTRLRAGVTRLLAPDDGAVAAWAAAFAKAPQAVPDLPPPPRKRLTRFVIGFVVGAHVALLLVLYWRSSPPPTPPAEITVELVREMPEQPKPKPEAKEAPKPVPLQPGDEKAKADGRKSNPASQQGSPDQKAKPEAKKAEEKPKAEEKRSEQPKPEVKPKVERPAKPTHQHQARHAPPRQEQPQQEAQAQQKPAQEQPRPAPDKAQNDPPPAMAAVALPGASDNGTEAVSYQQLVLSQVAKAKQQGSHMGVPGYAGVRFRVGEDGSLEMVKLVVSSGDPNLDIEAEAMIRRAAPFPKPPPGGRRDYGITLVFAAQPQQ